MSDKKILGFIGTGVMGASMAGHLLAAGNEVHVYNRTKERAMPRYGKTPPPISPRSATSYSPS